MENIEKSVDTVRDNCWKIDEFRALVKDCGQSKCLKWTKFGLYCRENILL